MRIFFAIMPPDEVKARLAEAVGRLTPAADDVVWCRREQFHLTLAFLGEAAPAILPHITAAAGRICAARSPFACHAYGLGYFGTRRIPRTFWAGVDSAPALNDLQETLWQSLGRYGFENKEKEFRPHITLGRNRGEALNTGLIEAMDADEAVEFGAWNVARITLYESKQTPRGPIYRTLAHNALTGN